MNKGNDYFLDSMGVSRNFGLQNRFSKNVVLDARVTWQRVRNRAMLGQDSVQL